MINKNVFFREFTFSNNNFKNSNSNDELEFADSVVWLDDILFIIQIKERGASDKGNLEKWFNNKVLNKGVKQVKTTHKYLSSFSDITIQNEKGHKKNIIEAREARKRSLIIYTTTEEIQEELRFKKFYESSEIGLIHLFHSEDYYWICRYLLTPAEVEEYLIFRENFYNRHGEVVDSVPEQYFLAHFFETNDCSYFKSAYMKNFEKIDADALDFNLDHIINNFTKHLTRLDGGPTMYYSIIAEIAKLRRNELAEFKKRFIRSCEDANKEDGMITPYRMYVQNTDCSFAFVPLARAYHEYRENALRNATEMLKYKDKARRCLGMSIVYIPDDPENFDILWMLIDDPWAYDPELETIVEENFPFRTAKLQMPKNRYGLDK